MKMQNNNIKIAQIQFIISIIFCTIFQSFVLYANSDDFNYVKSPIWDMTSFAYDISPDFRYFASFEFGNLYISDILSGNLKKFYCFNAVEIEFADAIKFSNDSKYIYIISTYISKIEIETGDIIYSKILTYNDTIFFPDMFFNKYYYISADNSYILLYGQWENETGNNCHITLWSLDNFNYVKTITDLPITSSFEFILSNDNKYLYLKCKSESTLDILEKIDIETGEIIKSIYCIIGNMIISGDNSKILGNTLNMNPIVLNTEHLDTCCIFSMDLQANGIDFTPDSKKIITHYQGISIIDLSTGKIEKNFDMGNYLIEHIYCSKDGDHFLTLSNYDNNQIALFSLNNGDFISSISVNSPLSTNFVFSKDSKYFAIFEKYLVSIIEPVTCKFINWNYYTNNSEFRHSFNFSHDNKYFLLNNSNNDLLNWDLNNTQIREKNEYLKN